MQTGFQVASSGTCSGETEVMTSLALVFVRFIRTLRHGLRDAEFRALLFVLTGLLVCGAIFYSTVEHWSVLDSLYFGVSTLATVGYGDLHPTTPLSKVFTMVYIVLGVGVFVAFITKVTADETRRRRSDR
jgi:voltage-gated potassium channel